MCDAAHLELIHHYRPMISQSWKKKMCEYIEVADKSQNVLKILNKWSETSKTDPKWTSVILIFSNGKHSLH